MLINARKAGSPAIGSFAILLGLLVAVFAVPSVAQVTTEVLTTATESAGPTSFNGSGYPFNRYYEDQRFQSIYLASDLSSSGVPAGALISRVDLKVSSTPSDAVPDFRVRIQQAATSSITGMILTGWSTSSSFGPTTFQTTSLQPTNWVQMTFATPFLWNGTDNLLLEFTSDGTSYTDNGNVFLRSVTGSGRSFFGYADSASAWPFDTGLFGNVGIAQVPSLRLTYSLPATPSIVTPAGPITAGVQGQPYTFTFSAAGGTPPYVWAVSSGTLPSGLSLNPSTGVLSGTPGPATANSTPYSFSVTVIDSGSQTAVKAFTLSIPPVSMVTLAGPLPAGFATVPYTFTFQATGGTGGPYAWSVTTGSVPPGLTLNPGTGVLSGTPTLALPSPASFTVQATDSVGSANVAVTLSIGAALVTAELLTGATETATNSSGYPFSRAWHDQRYQTVYLASELTAAGLGGGSTIASIHLKPSATLSQDVPNMRVRAQFSGTHTAYTGWVNSGWTLQNGPVNFTMAQVVPSQWIEFWFATPMVWNGTDNLLLEVSQDGTSYLGGGGIFTRASTANRTAYQYSDSGWAATPPGPTGGWPFDAAPTPIYAATVASLKISYQASATPVITTTALPNALEGTPYSANIVAAGGNGGPYTFGVTSGAFPSGLTLNTATGAVTGTPAAATNSATPYSITVSATDSTGTGVKTITLTVPVLGLGKLPGSLSNALGGFPYSDSVAGIGGGATKIHTISAGALPVGLTLNAVSGAITGSANVSQISATPYSFTVTISDGTSTVNGAYNILVTNPTFSIGTGTLTSTSSTPLYRSAAGSSFDFSAQKTLYLQSQLSGIPSGTKINGVSFWKSDTQSSTTGSSNVLKVWLKNSTLTAYPASEPFSDFDLGATLVYDSTTHTIPPVQGWINFGPFNQPTPFIYSGGALEVLVYWDCSSFTAGNPTTGSFSWRYTAPPNANTGLGYSSSAAPLPTSSLGSGTNGGSSRQPHILLELEPPVATDLDIVDVVFNATNDSGPSVGSIPNTVKVTVKSFGSAAYTGSYPLAYSTDGGITWTTDQSVTASGLNQLGDTQVVTMNAPWLIPAIGNQEIRVRITTPVAGDPDVSDMITRSYTVDADVDLVRVQTGPFMGNNNVVVRIKNNGTLSLNGVGIPLQFSTDGGTNYGSTETFTPTALGGQNTTQEYTFTAQWNLTVTGTYTLAARISPQLTGDPDPSDSNSTNYQDAGSAFELLVTAPESNSGGGTSSGHIFNTYYHDMRSESIYLASELTATGLYPSAQITAIQFKVFELPGMDLSNFRIRMKHTTSSTHPGVYATSGYSDVFGPTLIALSATPPVLVVGSWATFTLATPFTWNGTDNLMVDVTIDNTAYISGGGCFLRTPGTNARTLRGYSDSGYAWPYDLMTNAGTSPAVPSMRLMFPPPSDPGVAVTRSGNNINDASTDDLGNGIYATLSQTRTWTILNYGGSQALNITAVNLSNQTNVLATITANPAGTPIPSLMTAPLTLNIAPQAGPFSFDVELVTNSQTATQQSYTWTVTGVGFVNSIPAIAPVSTNDVHVSGTAPNYFVETTVGASLAFEVRAVDPDSGQTVNFTLAESTTPGSLTALQAGFTTTFPVVAAAGVSPRIISLAGTAAAMGTVNFTATSSDNGTIQANDTVNITVRIGAPLNFASVTANSQFVRTSGTKDFYRGQTGQVVDVALTNNNNFAIQVNSLTFRTVEKVSGAPVTGFTYTIQNGPVTIPANTANVPVTVHMAIAANASGANGVTVEFNGDSGVAVDPANASALIVFKVLSAASEFDLYDGPVPQPFAIVTNSVIPAVQTVPYTANLEATGGSQSYVWSISATTTHGLPDGLSLSPNGSPFLPASIFGVPTNNATAGTYAVTFNCTDGAYVDTVLLTITVSAFTPLNFTPITLPAAEEYVAYSMTTPFSATGGSLVYNFSVDPQSPAPLPAGLILNAQTGFITGTPASGTQGSHSIKFVVADGQNSADQTVTLLVNPHPLSWRTATIPGAEVTVAYQGVLDAIGGTGTRTFSIVTGSLPAGLTLVAATGAITGTPANGSAGTYNLTFRVTDSLNVSLDQAMSLVVSLPPPLAFSTPSLEYAEVGMTYAELIDVTGGSRAYTFSVDPSSADQLPAGLALAATGDITGTPALGTDGRYMVTIRVDDGFQTATHTYALAVLYAGTRGVAITEVDTGTGYVEISNSEMGIVDVSGWSIRIWVDGNNPLNLPFDTIPGASLMVMGETATFTIGGTAGGFWPAYSTGGSWSATASSNIAVQLLDTYGNTVDFVAFGSVTPSALTDGSSNTIELPGALGVFQPFQNGAANYSMNGFTWNSSAAGSFGAYNAGLASFPLAVLKDGVRNAVAGAAYSDFVIASGGVAPYSWSLTAPGATWLSLSTNGVFSGTAPAVGAATLVTMDVTVTDATTASVTETITFNIIPASAAPDATFAVGNAEGQSFEGTVIDVPVTMTRATGVTDVDGFSFVIELAAATAAELDVVRVLPGPALLAAGRSLVARDMDGTRLFIGDTDGLGNPTPVGDGVVAIIRFVVPTDDSVMAPVGTYPVSISDTGVNRNSTDASLAAGVNGQLVLSNFKPQDVNRDTAIDVVDVQLTVNLILQIMQPTYTGQGDANQDNNVDVVDVQTIVNCILLGGCN